MAARQRIESLLLSLDKKGQDTQAASGGCEAGRSSPGASSSCSSGNGRGGTANNLTATVAALLQERQNLEAAHAAELARRDADADALRRRFEGEIATLATRQAAVEAAAPLAAAQLAEVRAALQSGEVLEPLAPERATQLQALPQDRLSLVDAARLSVHRATTALQAEAQGLRRARDAAHEALRRAEDNGSRLKRDNARLAAAAAERQADGDAVVAALESRCARLVSELGEAAAAAEVMAAKGRRYDEVEGRAVALESEVARLKGEVTAASEAAVRLHESEELRTVLEARLAVVDYDRNHALEAAQRLEATVAARDEKVAALKRERADLRTKLSAAVAAGPRDEAECRLAREVRLLQNSRDEATEEVVRLKAELRDTVAVLTDTTAAARDERTRTDARIAELLSEVRVQGWELQQAKAQSSERAASLQRAEERATALEAKAAALLERCNTAEVEVARLSVQLDAAVAQLAQYEAADMGLAAAGVSFKGGLPAGPQQQLQGRPLRALGLQALAARCSQLEAANAALCRERSDAEGQAAKLRAEVHRLEDQVASLGQPARFAGEKLAEARARAREAEARAEKLQAQLQERDAKSASADQEKAALRSDLARLLRERGAFDSLRSLVAGALVKAPGGA